MFPISAKSFTWIPSSEGMTMGIRLNGFRSQPWDYKYATDLNELNELNKLNKLKKPPGGHHARTHRLVLAN